MGEITVIILTKNEAVNIAKCVNSAKKIAQRILVVDSGSTDATLEIAKKYGAETIYHEWCGHAAQFNWALDNCSIETEWVFRLDADERISNELAEEVNMTVSSSDNDVIEGYSMRWKVFFMNRWIKHGGTHKPYFLRLFRFGKGRVEKKQMDEHIIVNGRIGKLRGDLIHYDYKGIDAWLNKHIGYSNLELAMYYDRQPMIGGNESQKIKRSFYYKMPLFIRAKLYYIYRFYFQLGFLDGKEGKIFIYLQAYWYRFLVDVKIYEKEKNTEGNT